MINKDFLNSVVFDFNGDNHGVILLMVEAMKVVICEDDRRHAASVVEMGDMVDGLIWQRCLFLAEEVDPPLAKPPEMVLMVLWVETIFREKRVLKVFVSYPTMGANYSCREQTR